MTSGKDIAEKHYPGVETVSGFEGALLARLRTPLAARIDAAIAAAVKKAKHNQVLADCRAVRDKCVACENGVFARDNRGDAEECAYCGIPIRNIRAAYKAATGKELT